MNLEQAITISAHGVPGMKKGVRKSQEERLKDLDQHKLVTKNTNDKDKFSSYTHDHAKQQQFLQAVEPYGNGNFNTLMDYDHDSAGSFARHALEYISKT